MRHRLAKPTRSQGRRRKGRQNSEFVRKRRLAARRSPAARGRGIKDRAADQLAFDQVINHRFGSRRAAVNADEAAVGLRTGDRAPRARFRWRHKGHLTFDHVIDHRLACGGAAANPDHAAVGLELPPKRFGYDFHRAIEQDHVIGRAGRPAGSQGPDDDLNVGRANRRKRLFRLPRQVRDPPPMRSPSRQDAPARPRNIQFRSPHRGRGPAAHLTPPGSAWRAPSA